MSNDVAVSISQQQLIAGRFDHVGLRRLHTKLVLYAADKGLHGRNILQSVVVDWLIDCWGWPSEGCPPSVRSASGYYLSSIYTRAMFWFSMCQKEVNENVSKLVHLWVVLDTAMLQVWSATQFPWKWLKVMLPALIIIIIIIKRLCLLDRR